MLITQFFPNFGWTEKPILFFSDFFDPFIFGHPRLSIKYRVQKFLSYGFIMFILNFLGFFSCIEIWLPAKNALLLKHAARGHIKQFEKVWFEITVVAGYFDDAVVLHAVVEFLGLFNRFAIAPKDADYADQKSTYFVVFGTCIFNEF